MSPTASSHSLCLASTNSSRTSLQSSTVGSIGSIGNVGPIDHSFYNLSMENNRSNIDLTQCARYLPHHPYPSVYNHTITRDQGFYGWSSGASSSISLASSQFSMDKVNHAFGSLPPPCPVPSFSASSSSLPLVTSINSSIESPATARSKAIPTSPSLTVKHRSQCQGYRPMSYTLSDSDLPLMKSSFIQGPPSLRTQMLPSVAVLGQMSPRKGESSVVPSVNPDSIFYSVPLTPVSSTAMSPTSPFVDCSSPSSGKRDHTDVSIVPEPKPTVPGLSTPLTAMAKVDLVVAEAQYVAAMKRVEASLNQATENLGAAGRKDKDAIRLMIDRWSEMIKLHTKFHDDVNTMNEDLRGVAGLLNSLLVNLEPMLVSHSRDLPLTLKKLTRRDQNPEHVLAEWNSALRQPFEHLTSYGDWLQRVDPHSSFSQDCRTLLDGVIYKIHNAGDSHQPRNVLRRLSTIARMVTKRCSLGSSPPTPTRPNAPIDMDGPTLSFVEKLEDAPDYRYETVQDLEIARNDEVLETNPPLNVGHGQEKKLPALPTGVVADLTNGPTASSVNGIQHRMSRLSGLSNSGTLTTKDSSSRLSSSSSSSVRTKVSSFSETPRGKPSSASSAQIGEKIMAERESRKASLRVGTSDTIQARANSLQSTTCLIRPSIEGLRKVSSSSSSPSSTVTNAKNNKPPVQSLIAFWEQV